MIRYLSVIEKSGLYVCKEVFKIDDISLVILYFFFFVYCRIESVWCYSSSLKDEIKKKKWDILLVIGEVWLFLL